MLSVDWSDVQEVLIIHHNDMDGHFSAYIAKEYAKNEHNINDIQYIEVNYSSDRLKSLYNKNLTNSMIIIVDYSPSIEDIASFFCHNKTIKTRHIIWIDHHITAIEKFSRLYPKFYNVPGLRTVDKICAAELTYLYLYKNIQNVSRDPFKPSYINSSNKENIRYDIPEEMVNLATVGDYDTFRVNTKEMHMFNLYFRTYEPEFKLNEETDNFFKYMLNSDNFDDIIQIGQTMKDYVDSNNKAILRKCGFAGVLRKFEDISCICVNTHMNSTIFDSVKDDYEVGIVFSYDGNKRRMFYTVYRLNMNPDRFISCAKIAESYGGGGHERAAGFSTSGVLEIKPL